MHGQQAYTRNWIGSIIMLHKKGDSAVPSTRWVLQGIDDSNTWQRTTFIREVLTNKQPNGWSKQGL
jgi:hypothetical protein